MKTNHINYLKVFMTVILIAVLAAGCCACGNNTIQAGGAENQIVQASPAPVEVSPAPVEETVSPDDSPESNADENIIMELSFSTVDIDGNEYSSGDYSGASVIMVNFWEPWCGPCVGEMADLEKLYENYKDKGFLILGVYAAFDMEQDAKEIIQSKGISYPILRATEEFYPYMTSYVPTSFFIDGRGRLLHSQPFVGANSYSNWESIISNFLNEET